MMDFQFIPTPLFALSDGIFKEANQSFLNLIGYEWKELYDQDFYCIVSPEFHQVIKKETEGIHKDPWYIELKIVQKSCGYT